MKKKKDSAMPELAPPALPAPAPRHDEVAARAYEIFLRRGGTPHHELEDWLAAEQELLARQNVDL
jgi:hypothetical protein